MSIGRDTKEIRAEILSPGMAEGTLYLWDFSGKRHTKQGARPLQADKEIERFEKGLNSLTRQLEQSIKSLQKDDYIQEAEIIRTHLYLLKDPQFRKDIRDEIQTNKIAAEEAVDSILREMIKTFEQSESSVFYGRASDIRDVVNQLKQKLSQREKHLWDYLRGLSNVILAVRELTPSLLLEARKQKVTGFIVKEGTSLSHAIILAKSFGLPVVRIPGFHYLEPYIFQLTLIDGTSQRVVFEPSDKRLAQIKSTQTNGVKEFFKDLSVNLWINIIDPQQVTPELIKKIKGVGLYRTEALFMEQEKDFPSEQKQMETYNLLFEKSRDIPVTFRTADIGGDKMLPYFSLGPQENPYLGFRAHRIYRFHPEIFVTQLKAVLKAAVNASQLKLLYPMIETTDELFFVQDLVTKAIDSLKKEGVPYKQHFQQGVMIEVPSIAWNCREILGYVDFASLGTNDLFQYFFAVDRNNTNAYHSYQPENPAAIRMLKYLVDTAEQLNKPLSICGEIASDKRFLPLLIGLGLKEISIDSHMLNDIGLFISGLDIMACKDLADKCLASKTSRQVNAILNEFMPKTVKAPEKIVTESADLIDPVCGMVVHFDDSYVLEHKGESHYFCSIQCKNEFERGLTDE